MTVYFKNSNLDDLIRYQVLPSDLIGILKFSFENMLFVSVISFHIYILNNCS